MSVTKCSRAARLQKLVPAAFVDFLATVATATTLLTFGFLSLFVAHAHAHARNSGDPQPRPRQQEPFQLFLLSDSDGIGRNEQRQILPDRLMADVSYFDRLSVNSQLNNKEFVETQIRCLIYDGPCDFFGRKAKELLPSIILDNCRLCTDTQKNKLSRVVVHLQQHYPGPWRDALVKYGSSPKFITAGQVAPGATFFGVVPHHKKPHHYYEQLQNDEYVGVVHFRGSTPEPTVYAFNGVNPVIPTPQTATAASIDSTEDEHAAATPAEAGATSVKRNVARVSISEINQLRPLMTMSSTLVAPIPVLASMGATSTSPIPDELPGVVESPPVYPTTTMMQNEYGDSTASTMSDFDLSPSSSSVQPPSTSVVESTIEIKPTTTEPLRSQ